MSIGAFRGPSDDVIEQALNRTLKSLNRPDILIEKQKASTQSFHEFVNKRKKSGEDKSIDLFDPLSQSNSDLKKIDDLYDVIVPDEQGKEEDYNNASRYRNFYN